jgi:hypothetical protein
VAIKQYSGEKVMNAIYEIINNSRITETHPNVVALRAVQVEVFNNSDYISQVRLMFDRLTGWNLKDFILDKSGKLKGLSLRQKKVIYLNLFKQIV